MNKTIERIVETVELNYNLLFRNISSFETHLKYNVKIHQYDLDNWTIKAPAKLNLFFEVLGKREDGYHEIESLVYPIGLYDTLQFRRTEDGILNFECTGDCSENIPNDENNLVLKALNRLRHETGTKYGAFVHLEKKIPVQAGLGGGSSDAAAALSVAARAWNLDIVPKRLSELAVELGSDVPLFLCGSPVIVRGRGEIIEPIPDYPKLNFVILKPPFGISTADAYRDCMKFHDNRFKKCPEPDFTELDSVKIPEELAKTFFNRLEKVSEHLRPELESIRIEFERTGPLLVRMSGSGTALFGLARDREDAERIACSLEKRKLGKVYIVGAGY